MNEIKTKKEIGLEAIVFITIFFSFFVFIAKIMGFTNMIKTIMNTAFYLLSNVCFYLMAVAVIAGGITGLFSEFGVFALINKVLSVIMKPLYDLPGVSSLGILNCFMSDNPSILTFAADDNFRKYFKKYQLPALTNLGTSFGMGLIVTTSMMSFKVEHSMKAAFIGFLGAIIGSIISVRLVLKKSKKVYGKDEMVSIKSSNTIEKGRRIVREGSIGSRFINSLLDGGKVGVDMGLSIIPGVLLICTIVILLTNTYNGQELYDGSCNQGIGLLPIVGQKLSFILEPLFGFKDPSLVAVPITALGSAGASVAMVAEMVSKNIVTGNDIAVFTSICMCWSGYLSTHIAMMDTLKMKEMTGHAIISHTIGGIAAGISAHIISMIFL